MSEKRLFQCNWSRGQTDGEPVPGTVRRILNMDMRDPGRLRTRNGFIASGTSVPSIDNSGLAVFIDYTPDWSTADSWICVLAENSIIMVPVVGTVVDIANKVALSIPGFGVDETVDFEKSQLVASGDKVIALIVKSGSAYGETYMVIAPESNNRFRGPATIRGTSIEVVESSIDDAWIVYKVKGARPVLTVKAVAGYAFLDDDFAGLATTPPDTGMEAEYHWPCNKSDVYRFYSDAVAATISEMRENGNQAVGIVAVVASPDDDMDGVHHSEVVQPVGMFGRTAVIEFRVQYLYYDGQMSQLSEPVTFSDWENFTITDPEDEVFKYSVGIGLIVPTGVDRSVKGIQIYRKALITGNPDLDADTEPQLIATHWLDSKVLEELEEDLGAINVDYKIASDWWRRHGWATNADNFDLNTPFCSWEWHSGSSTWDPRRLSDRRIKCYGGTCYKTSGWVGIASGFAMYFDHHYGASCTFSYEETGPYVVENIRTTFAALIASRYNGQSGVLPCLIRYGCDMPSFGIKVRSTSPEQKMLRVFARPQDKLQLVSQFGAFTQIAGGLPADGLAAIRTSGSALVFGSNYASATYDVYGSGSTMMGERIPLVVFRDTGNSPRDSESSFMGGRSEDVIDVKPLAITVSGGRLLGIGGLHNGRLATSRFWYSLFQNFGLVLDGNYLDYGARGDGTGVAVSAFRGRILIHFSSATYIVDATGGSDMAWRELGANSGVGLLNKYAIAETPIGNVWADKNGVYIFNGRGMNEITNVPEAGVTLRDSYKAMIAGSEGDVRVFFKNDTSQVWVCVGVSALVWDIETGAWHENVLSELMTAHGPDAKLMGFVDVGGVQNAVALDSTGTVHFHPESSFESHVLFDWGLDVYFDGGSTEIVKKAKRFYLNAMTELEGKTLNAIVKSQGGAEMPQVLRVPQTSDMNDPDVDTMIRFSASTRGRMISISLRNEDQQWSGVIESLGMSHKLKALK